MPARALERPQDRPLHDDVGLLGRLLGEVIVAREGRAVFDLVERVRRLAIRRRRGPGRQAAADELARLVDALPTEQAEPVIRAFSLYFQLVNLAEQHHRIRRARAHASDPREPPQRGSLAAAMLEARKAGVAPARLRETLQQLEVTLSLTAHPSQAVRRAVLDKLYRLVQLLAARDERRLLPREAKALQESMREEIAALWQTDEIRHARPTVNDEVKNVLWYLERVFVPAAGAFGDALEEAFDAAGAGPAPDAAPLRLHSWVGGDMDGNPLVTPEVFEDAMRVYTEAGLRSILGGVRALASRFSQSQRYAEPTRALLAAMESDARLLPDVDAEFSRRAAGEPWRRKLAFVQARLERTLDAVAARRGGVRAVPTGAYSSPDELAADLRLVADSAEQAAVAGARRARALARRVESAGFQVAELELRVHADDVREAAAFLEGGPSKPGGQRLLEALRRLAAAQRESGPQACRTVIISMAASADDVLAVLRCARACGLWDAARGCATVDVVPLLETLDALQHGPQIIESVLTHALYRPHVQARGVQEVMVGYSDSGKETGLLSAAEALWRAQRELPSVGARAGVGVRLFHGRGETVARGGGPAQQAILALPPGAVAGRYKATEQGEALDHKYGWPELAHRTLELVVGGALLHSLDAQQRPDPQTLARYEGAFARLAEIGRREYRALVWEEPLFVEFFRAASPHEEITELPIGSRPAKRAAGGLEALRAIPWVFAWNQNRAILPGWYGVGSALEGASRADRELAREMYQAWPFFKAVVDNVEMVLAKADLDVAARYAALAPARARKAVWPRIEREHELTRRHLLAVAGHRSLLDGNPPLQRTLALRNPYVDPLSLLQVELLRRRRAGRSGCERPLLLTVNGVAAGMRNTG